MWEGAYGEGQGSLWLWLNFCTSRPPSAQPNLDAGNWLRVVKGNGGAGLQFVGCLVLLAAL